MEDARYRGIVNFSNKEECSAIMDLLAEKEGIDLTQHWHPTLSGYPVGMRAGRIIFSRRQGVKIL